MGTYTVGAVIGVVLRFWVGYWVYADWGFPFPLLMMNLAGGVLLGVLYSYHLDQRRRSLFLYAMMGVVSSFAVLAPFSYETFVLLQNGNVTVALQYVVATLMGVLICGLAGKKTVS
ncbi:CrcB family protein [Pontibacillus sp. ALD_SL1]|uniref:fluoride efflux transporter FluC n=1 Tax=Pontibacillus sp. ALD_SL1 TaxID=2777185 RepID=UPI001F60DCC9|nr:CrcB family protein [Pontibacillus sp. ALD_SL1]